MLSHNTQILSSYRPNIYYFSISACVSMLTSVNTHQRQSTEADYKVNVSFAVICSQTKVSDESTCWPFHVSRWKVKGSRKGLQFILRGAWISVPNFMAINSITGDISLQTTNVKLLVALQEKSSDNQCEYDCILERPWMSVRNVMPCWNPCSSLRYIWVCRT